MEHDGAWGKDSNTNLKLYNEFQQLQTFEEQLQFYEHYQFDPYSILTDKDNEEIRICLNPKTEKETESKNMAKFAYHELRNKNSFQNLRIMYYRKVSQSANPRQFTQNEIDRCIGLIEKNDSIRHMLKKGYDDAVNAIPIDYIKGWKGSNEAMWYVHGRGLAFYIPFLERRLEQLQNPSTDKENSNKPYPLSSDYQKLADILLPKVGMRIYDEVIKDWIEKFRIPKLDFLYEFERFLAEENKQPKRGIVSYRFKMWQRRFSNEFLFLENLTVPSPIQSVEPRPEINVHDYIKDELKFISAINLMINHEEEYVIKTGVGSFQWNYSGKGQKVYFVAFIEVLRKKGYIRKPNDSNNEYAEAFCPYFGFSKPLYKQFEPNQISLHIEKQSLFEFIPYATTIEIDPSQTS